MINKIQEIFNKGSFNIEDMAFLMANKHALTKTQLVTLGLEPSTDVESSPVVDVVEPKKGKTKKSVV